MADDKKYSAELLKDGTILVTEEPDGRERFRFDLLCKYFDIMTCGERASVSITRDNRLLIAGYGIGYLYFISLSDGKIIKQMKLFPEVSYEDNSFKDIDDQGYYDMYPRLDFSRDGKYAVIRVRGYFDPQSYGGDFSPIYVRSFFLMDMETLEIVFGDDYSDIPDGGYLNLAVVAFSPDSRFLVTASLGGTLKVFDLEKKCEVFRCEPVEWVPYSTAVDHRELAVFLDAQTFVFVSKRRNIEVGFIVKVQRQPDGSWKVVQTIDTAPYMSDIDKEGTIFDIDYIPDSREIVCYYTYTNRIKNKFFTIKMN